MSSELPGADKPGAAPRRLPAELAFLDRNDPNEIEPAHRVGYVVFDVSRWNA